MSLNNLQPQGNEPNPGTKINGYSSRSLQAIEYLSKIVEQSDQQYLDQLIRLENQDKLEHNQQSLNLENKDDPITRLQNLMGIPPEIKEYQQQINHLNNQISILEDKLANTVYLIKQLIPFLSREPSKTRQKIAIFKALQEQLILEKDTSKVANLVYQNQHQELLINQLRDKVNNLENRLEHPHNFINILVPLVNQKIKDKTQIGEITKALEEEIRLNHEELLAVVASIVTEVVDNEVRENKQDLEQALQPILVSAFTQQIQTSGKEIAQVITPQIASVIENQISLNQQAMVSALAPIIDQVVRQNIQQEQALMTKVLAPIIPPAISQTIQDSPQEIAKAIAPEIADAINEQIRLEKGAMVDALYPILGNTVAKAIGETIRTINQKAENALSPEGIRLKFRAKVKGVSEAELLLAEHIQFKIRAVFLIQKQSGLVISSQQFEEQKLESEMVAGMLTAIRSFVSEYILSPENSSDIREIDYGNSQIILEMAGYCYLAVVTDGTPNQQYRKQMRNIFAQIIQDYGQTIEAYEGDPQTVPEQVKQLLASLKENKQQVTNQPQRPPALAIISLVILSLLGIWWGASLYQNWQHSRLINKVIRAFHSHPELTQYDLSVAIENQTLQLRGIVPQRRLRQQASEISQQAVPSWSINNNILALESLVDPLFVEVRIKELQGKLNQQLGVDISTKYTDGKVIIEGKVPKLSSIIEIKQKFADLPGVNTAIDQLKIEPFILEQKVYFRVNSTQLETTDINNKVREVSRFLKLNPDKKLKIIGFSNRLADSGNTQKIAYQRAKVVQKVLESQGIESQRLRIASQTNFPSNVGTEDPLWLTRCVTFTLIE